MERNLGFVLRKGSCTECAFSSLRNMREVMAKKSTFHKRNCKGNKCFDSKSRPMSIVKTTLGATKVQKVFWEV